MRYAITFLEEDYARLLDHLFRREEERAAFLLCARSESTRQTRLLVREVLPVSDADIESSSERHMSIRSSAYVPLLKRANDDDLTLVFVHSHPEDCKQFSTQDDREEAHLFRTAFNRIERSPVHASLVFAGRSRPIGRVWLPSLEHRPIARTTVVGRRLRILDTNPAVVPQPEIYDRQARAFGPDLQPILKGLHVGIVGGGGTGSPTFEELVRLGVGEITIIDPDFFAATNVNRVFGSRTSDDGRAKVEIARDSASAIGLGTVVNPIPKHLSFKSTATLLRDCDVVFGATDDEWGRSILTTFAAYYGVPVIDMGVSIDTDGTRVRSVTGRVTILQPGHACLFCRNRVTTAGVSAESLRALSPDEADARVAEGYLAGVPEPAPSVVTFTASVASIAVAELLNMLTGFVDPDVEATELLIRFHMRDIRRNAPEPRTDCFCADRRNWLRGDRKRFLNLQWRPE